MAASYIDQIMELEAKKQELMTKAKAEALSQAEKAVADLNDLGFHFRLVETDSASAPSKTRTTRSPRKGGISEQVLATLSANPDGLIRADILEKMGAASDDKQIQSISNALSNLSKANKVTRDKGIWKAA